jgi:hypothetical protein
MLASVLGWRNKWPCRSVRTCSKPIPAEPAHPGRFGPSARRPPQRPHRPPHCCGSTGGSAPGQHQHRPTAHPGRDRERRPTVTVEQADISFRVYDAGQLLIEVTRATTATVARFKARKPEPSRQRRLPSAQQPGLLAGAVTNHLTGIRDASNEARWHTSSARARQKNVGLHLIRYESRSDDP